MLIDIHTHRPRSWKCIVNVHAADFLSSKNIEFNVFSIGEHPWWSNSKNVEILSKKFKNNCPKGLAAIGECGLDRAKGPDLEKQKNVLEQQLKLARELNLPVIIHQVKTQADIFPFIKKYNSLKFIFHGFRGNDQQMEQLLDYPVFFSLGEAIINPHKKMKNMLQKIPANRVFFETDEADIDIKLVYEAFLPFFNGDLAALENQIEQNFNKLFKHLSHELE